MPFRGAHHQRVSENDHPNEIKGFVTNCPTVEEIANLSIPRSQS
jgi:hypothetical protein